MDPAPRSLRVAVRAELAAPAPRGAQAFVEPIRRRHGHAVAALLFYGSCLRRRSEEGVLDFYVVVDAYRPAYGLRPEPDKSEHARRARLRPALLAAANALLPPNVFYLEVDSGAGTLRAKYAVMSRRDFRRAAGPGAWQPRVWARFAQPCRLVWARDAATRDEVVEAVASATTTTLEWAVLWASDRSGMASAEPAALLAGALGETYRAELRGEQSETIASLATAAAADRTDILEAALETLQAQGRLERFRASDGAPRARIEPARVRRARARWRVQRPAAKLLAAAGLLKTALTFDDWVGYVLWKLERHSGTPIEVSDRQRRHPFLYGWPVLLRLLRAGVLR